MPAVLTAQTFDLDSTEARSVQKSGRVNRFMIAAVAVFFLAITVYAVAGLPRAISDSKNLGVYVSALLLISFMTFLTVSGAMVNFKGPASKLILTDEGVEIRFLSGGSPKFLRWTDSSFRLTLRDFRGHATPMSNRIQIERVGRAPFWLQVPTSPLTPEAFDALVAKSREKGLTVTHRKGSTKFALYPNTETMVRRPAPG